MGHFVVMFRIYGILFIFMEVLSLKRRGEKGQNQEMEMVGWEVLHLQNY